MLQKIRTNGSPDSRNPDVAREISTRASAPTIRAPLVSVIITNFNYRNYIEQTLRSVASQTYPHWECVFVDDCSTDGSFELAENVVRGFDDDRFCTLRLGRNSGQMAAIKVGVENSSGSFVVFLDADDILLPEFLQTHVSAHLCDAFSAGVTASDTILIDSESTAFHGTYFTHHRARGEPTAKPGIFRTSGFGAISVGQSLSIAVPDAPELLLIELWVPGWHIVATSSLMFRRDILPCIPPHP